MTANLAKKMLKALKGVEMVSLLSKSDKEELALMKAIIKGRSGKYVDTASYLKKIKGE